MQFLCLKLHAVTSYWISLDKGYNSALIARALSILLSHFVPSQQFSLFETICVYVCVCVCVCVCIYTHTHIFTYPAFEISYRHTHTLTNRVSFLWGRNFTLSTALSPALKRVPVTVGLQQIFVLCCACSVAKSCLTLCDLVYCSLREGSGTPLQYSCLENPMDGGAWWAAVHGVSRSRTWLSDFTFTFHFHALEKEMATHSSVLAWRIPGTGEPGGLLSMGSHRVGHDWSDVAAAVAAVL